MKTKPGRIGRASPVAQEQDQQRACAVRHAAKRLEQQSTAGPLPLTVCQVAQLKDGCACNIDGPTQCFALTNSQQSHLLPSSQRISLPSLPHLLLSRAGLGRPACRVSRCHADAKNPKTLKTPKPLNPPLKRISLFSSRHLLPSSQKTQLLPRTQAWGALLVASLCVMLMPKTQKP